MFGCLILFYGKEGRKKPKIDKVGLRIFISVSSVVGIAILLYLPNAVTIGSNPLVWILAVMFFVPWLQLFIDKISAHGVDVYMNKTFSEVQEKEPEMEMLKPNLNELIREYQNSIRSNPTERQGRRRGR